MASRLNRPLLSEATVNTTGEALWWSSPGPGSIHVYGTWDGATVTIQGSTDEGATWTDVPSGVFTEDTLLGFDSGHAHVRAVLSNAGNTSLTATLASQGKYREYL